jgi:hypothetical protein
MAGAIKVNECIKRRKYNYLNNFRAFEEATSVIMKKLTLQE